MQILREICRNPGTYDACSAHRAVSAPKVCPNCNRAAALAALGYYSRNVTVAGRVARILVRRFRCFACGKTVSVLPCFAQPYRLVQNETIDRFFRGETTASDLPWVPLLQSYRNSFIRWLPELIVLCGSLCARPPPRTAASAWWGTFAQRFGTLEISTPALIESFGVTLFGRYRCHSPNPA